MEAALRTAYEVITKKPLPAIELKAVRGLDGIREASVDVDGLQVNVAVVFSLSNVHKLLTEIKEGKRHYHFIEVMTCPGGCIGGGGQPYPPADMTVLDPRLPLLRAKALYKIDSDKQLRRSHENPAIEHLYQEFLGEPNGEKAHHLLHTHYHASMPRGIR